jgi:hypothetical protein
MSSKIAKLSKYVLLDSIAGEICSPGKPSWWNMST